MPSVSLVTASFVESITHLGHCVGSINAPDLQRCTPVSLLGHADSGRSDRKNSAARAICRKPENFRFSLWKHKQTYSTT
ncbi:hypothetical protein BH09CHL1_BH09CHL1_34090 [soil metagenome]